MEFGGQDLEEGDVLVIAVARGADGAGAADYDVCFERGAGAEGLFVAWAGDSTGCGIAGESWSVMRRVGNWRT